ncbi:MAG: hemin-degrading factor [Burkholderiaceae bacterium]
MNTQASLADTLSRDAISRQWDRISNNSTGLRAIEIAGKIGVSEAQLIDSRVGHWVVCLDPAGFGELLRTLPRVGEIMALTRNASVVHEKVGTFGNVTVQPGHALVLNREIDLRLFMSHWCHGFAVSQPLDDGTLRNSLQFFDACGRAVHKIFARPETDKDAWENLVLKFSATVQSEALCVNPLPGLPADLPDGQIDVSGLKLHWAAMRDTHDFFGMLRDFKVGRHQAMRLIGAEFAEPLALSCARDLLEQAATDRTPIMCFVGNPGCIQIHTGPITRVKTIGDWLNVLDPGFNLHLRADHIASAWLVRKPTDDGIVTSVEIFDDQNRQFVQFFGERKPGAPELESWRELVQSLPRRSEGER